MIGSGGTAGLRLEAGWVLFVGGWLMSRFGPKPPLRKSLELRNLVDGL